MEAEDGEQRGRPLSLMSVARIELTSIHAVAQFRATLPQLLLLRIGENMMKISGSLADEARQGIQRSKHSCDGYYAEV